MSSVSASASEAALAYHEPQIETVLIQSAFLILLNVLNWALDRLLNCGLIGQILIGLAWGTPGAQLLSREAEHVVVQLGYIGLILVVFEGGLATSFPSLRANLLLSAGVAATGIAAPIALSFILASLVGASALQCFAAGAALCSTSLGTTFTVLRATGLASTRLGVVLTSAAMLDDVVGLVMIQVISNLGSAGASISAVTVIRPIFVSIGLAVAAVAACYIIVKPATVWLNRWRKANHGSRVDKFLRLRSTALCLHTLSLVGLVAASSYAGTSNLFAAYIAGAAISWWDTEVPHQESPIASDGSAAGSHRESEAVGRGVQDPAVVAATPVDTKHGGGPSPSGIAIFEQYYHPATKWVLQPFFFASIGFSIPITRMFSGPIVWKGIVYAALMALGKLACGIWLVRAPGLALWIKSIIKNQTISKEGLSHLNSTHIELERSTDVPRDGRPTRPAQPSSTPPPVSSSAQLNTGESTHRPAAQTSSAGQKPQMSVGHSRNSIPSPPKPLSLYPCDILGLAMVPRGEIGFLISSIAQANGVFGGDTPEESEIFLIVTWAVVLCTVIGPLCLGLLVRRVKRLDEIATTSASKNGDGSPRDVLGVWGVRG